jgi:hypothetical protein
MSLVSLISEDHPALWRPAFGIAGGIGAALFLGVNYGRLLFMEPPHSPDET